MIWLVYGAGVVTTGIAVIVNVVKSDRPAQLPEIPFLVGAALLWPVLVFFVSWMSISDKSKQWSKERSDAKAYKEYKKREGRD